MSGEGIKALYKTERQRVEEDCSQFYQV